MNNQVASPPSMSSSSFVTAAVRVKKEVDEDEVEPPTVVSSSLSAAAIPATSMRMGLKKEEDDISNGNAETGDGNYDGGPRHGSVRCTVKKEEKDDDDGHQNNTQNPTTIRSTTMVPDAAISSSSSNSNTGSHSGGTENDNRANSDDADDEYNDDANDHHHVKKWEAGNWCWLDDYTSNDMKHQKKEEEEEEERKEEKLNNGTNGDDDTGVKTEENGHYDNNFDTNTSRNAGDDDTGVKKEEEEDNDNSFGNTNNSRNDNDDTKVKKEKEKDDDGRGFDTTNENKNRNTCTRTDVTVSDITIKDNDDYYDDWTTGNWCLEGRPHSTTTNGKSSAVGSAAAISVTVSTGTKNKRKLRQSRENHKKKPRTINQNNKHKNNNNTNLDEDDNNDGLHDEGNDDGDDDDDDKYDDDDDDDDDYSDVDCDDSNDDESEPNSGVVAESSMNNGGVFVRNKYEEQWNKMYGRLLNFKNKYKTTSVPFEFDSDGCRLGSWVNQQRTRQKNNKLSTARINRLNSIDFVWSKYDAQWTNMYARLVRYKNQYNSTCVPQSHKADPQLGKWVMTQRLSYNKLSTEKRHQLNLIDFVWDPLLDVRWADMFERLVAYKKQYNSTCVPRSYTADTQLATWVNNLRNRNNKLTAERKDQLNSIDFVCDPHDVQWLEMYDRLVQYKTEHKTTCVPNSYPEDPKLGRWVGKQRTHYKKNSSSLTTERKHQLNLIGFVWDPYDKRWTDMYDRLVEYKQQHKSTCVPSIYKDDPQLATWVHTQRTHYNRNSSSLTADRIKLLNSIGFIWKTRNYYGRNV